MTWLYTFQFALPLILIGWLMWVPARSGLGFVVLVLGSGTALAVMALQGIWPPLPRMARSILWCRHRGAGRVRGEPHLHVHAQLPGLTEAPLGGDPRPIQFNGRFPVRGDRVEAP